MLFLVIQSEGLPQLVGHLRTIFKINRDKEQSDEIVKTTISPKVSPAEKINNCQTCLSSPSSWNLAAIWQTWVMVWMWWWHCWWSSWWWWQSWSLCTCDHLGEVEVVLVDVDVNQLHHSVLQVSLVWPEQMLIVVQYLVILMMWWRPGLGWLKICQRWWFWH